MRAFLVFCLFAAILHGANGSGDGSEYKTWQDYGGGPGSAQYSGLRQIDRSNVKKLKVAWSYSTGDKAQVLLQPAGGEWADVRHGEEQLHRGAGCRQRAGVLGASDGPNDEA